LIGEVPRDYRAPSRVLDSEGYEMRDRQKLKTPPPELRGMSLRQLAEVVEVYGLEVIKLELIHRRERWPNCLDDSDYVPPG
jgi:hypothetical protein